MTVDRQEPGRTDLFFFLSFVTSSESDDRLVEQFFRDLENEVRAAAGLRGKTPVGFLSNASLRLGVDWWEQLRTALGNSAVFVALCSPLYFRSVACGREWQAFATRAAELEKRTGTVAPVLLPVWWIPTPMPDSLERLQFADRAISEHLHTDGLRKSMIVGSRRHYRKFVIALGNRIVETARDHRVPPTKITTDYDRMPQAFPGPAPRTPPTATTPARDDVVEPPSFDNPFPRL